MKKNELRIINSLLALSHASSPPQETLLQIAHSLNHFIHADRSVIYLSDSSNEGLVLAAEVKAEDKPSSPAYLLPDSALVDLSRTYGEAQKVKDPSGFNQVWTEYRYMVIIPFTFNDREGVFIILSHTQNKLKSLSLPFLSVLGETFSLILEDLLKSETIKAKLNEMRLLYEIGRSTYSTLDLGELIPLVARHIAESLNCDSGHIMLHLKKGSEGSEMVSYSWPYPPDEKFGSSISFEKFHQRIMVDRSMKVDLLCSPEKNVKGKELPQYFSGFPLACQQDLIGSAILLHNRPLSGSSEVFFQEDRLSFMEAMSALVSMAVANALNYAEANRLALENQSRAHELSIFFKISQVLAGTMSLDDVLKIILTAATLGHGLGFNRAALFLINEKTNMLQGMMGVGPDNVDEAVKIWNELSSKNWDLSEALKMSLTSPTSTTFPRVIKTVRLPVQPESGVLALAAIEKKPFNITDTANDPRTNKTFIETTGFKAFAVAPLIADGKVLGVLAVDNLYNNRLITSKDLQMLATFANQAALALNSAQLYNRLGKSNLELKNMYRKLSQSERLATLGELAATVAHEVRNPLVSVGGFARRLEKRLDKSDPNRRYTSIILKEINRLEHFLNEILIFSRDIPLSLAETDINRSVLDLAEFFSEELKDKNIVLELQLDEKIPSIEADPEHLSQILMNFFTNSIDALSKGGNINIKTSFLEKENYVCLTFSDNGGGVPENVLCDIFNPFFTTKSGGTGLGLPLVQKMVKYHHGSIEIRNVPGKSISFSIKLPLTPDRNNAQNSIKEEQS